MRFCRSWTFKFEVRGSDIMSLISDSMFHPLSHLYFNFAAVPVLASASESSCKCELLVDNPMKPHIHLEYDDVEAN